MLSFTQFHNPLSLPKPATAFIFFALVVSACSNASDSDITSSMKQEIEWAQREIAKIEAIKEDQDTLSEDLATILLNIVNIEKIVPPEPGISTYVDRLRFVADFADVEIDVSELRTVQHESFDQIILKLSAVGTKESMLYFQDTAGRISRLSSWRDPEYSDQQMEVEISIFVSPRLGEPEIQPCNAFENETFSLVDFKARKVRMQLQALCEQIESESDARIQFQRWVDALDHLRSILELVETYSSPAADSAAGVEHSDD